MRFIEWKALNPEHAGITPPIRGRGEFKTPPRDCCGCVCGLCRGKGSCPSPGVKDLAELAETLKMLRDKPAPAAILVQLRFFHARVVELSEEVIIWRRRPEGKPPITWSPELSPPPSHWGPPHQAQPPRKVVEAQVVAPAASEREPEPLDEAPAADPPPRVRFRAVCLRLGLSQAAFAARLGGGWTGAMVSQLETARRPCSDEVLALVERW